MNIKEITTLSVSAAIEKNIADEATAREGYFELLEMLDDPADRAVIEEIISDELNHSEKLKALSLKFNGVAPASS